MATFLKCIKYALKCVTDMVLYNICGRIFDPRLIGTDSRRMEQICNSYIVQICTDNIYDSEVLCILVPKRREGSRGTFSARTQGVANGLSHVVYRPGLIVRGVFSTAMAARIRRW